MLGVNVRVLVTGAVTVNGPLADFPVFPTATTLYAPTAALDDTVNPTLMFPPPMMLHDGEDSNPEGLDVSMHDTSLENPVAEPVTTVPDGPDVGVSVKALTTPVVTVNVAVAESVPPKLLVAVTV